MKKYIYFTIIGLHLITICHSQVESSTKLFIQDCNKAFTLDGIPLLQKIYYEDSIVTSDAYIGSVVIVPYDKKINYIGFGDTIKYNSIKEEDTLCLSFDNQAFSKQAIIKTKQLTFKEILISFLKEIVIDNYEKYNVQFDQLKYSVSTILKSSDSIYQRYDTILVNPYKNIFGKGITLKVAINKDKSKQKIKSPTSYILPYYDSFIEKLIFYDIDDLLKSLDNNHVYVNGSREKIDSHYYYSFEISNVHHIFGDEILVNIVNKSGLLYIDEIKSIYNYTYKNKKPKYFFEKRYIRANYSFKNNGHYPKDVEILLISRDTDNSHFEKLITKLKIIENNFTTSDYNLKTLPSYDDVIAYWIKYNLNL